MLKTPNLVGQGVTLWDQGAQVLVGTENKTPPSAASTPAGLKQVYLFTCTCVLRQIAFQEIKTRNFEDSKLQVDIGLNHFSKNNQRLADTSSVFVKTLQFLHPEMVNMTFGNSKRMPRGK